MNIPCDYCKKELRRKPSNIAKYKHHFCSKVCANSFQTPNLWVVGKKCDFCKKVIVNKRASELAKYKHSFCSRLCYEEFKKVKKQYFPCEICGKLIYKVPRHAARVKKHYCSKRCNGVGNRKFRNCLNCNISHNNKANWKFCSRKCYVFYVHKTNYLKTEIKQNCPFCGKLLNLRKGLLGKLAFCGRICADKYHSQRMLGKGNSNFIHGNSSYPYPAIWNNVFKELIRKRDNYQCKLCGILQSSLKRKLHIHHIDWDKDHTYPLNLISLCHPCHRKCHQKKERLEKLLLKQLQKKAKFLTESIILESKITTTIS